MLDTRLRKKSEWTCDLQFFANIWPTPFLAGELWNALAPFWRGGSQRVWLLVHCWFGLMGPSTEHQCSAIADLLVMWPRFFLIFVIINNIYLIQVFQKKCLILRKESLLNVPSYMQSIKAWFSSQIATHSQKKYYLCVKTLIHGEPDQGCTHIPKNKPPKLLPM